VQYTIHDNSRQLEFEGTLLASSSSRQPDSERWVEFDLYLTAGGSYVLTRVGRSLLYHDEECVVVQRNNLEHGEPSPDSRPCTLCKPPFPDDLAEDDLDYIRVEKPRHWVQVSDNVEAVLNSLYKYDADGTRYLTLVARRLVEQAGKHDPRIERAYRVERVS